MAIIVVSFSFSQAAQPEAWGLSFLLSAGFLYYILSPTGLQTPSRAPSAGWWLSLPHLFSNFSDLQLTDFLSSPSYIIVQSPTQSLEWHVWSSSSGNNCHAVQRSLSSGASVYECTMGFYLVPYCQPSPPTRFLLITAIGMCHFRCITLEWHVWPGRRSIYNKIIWLILDSVKRGKEKKWSVSILIRNDIPQRKINLNINLQAITAKATGHRTINICSLYIPPQDSINENGLKNLM